MDDIPDLFPSRFAYGALVQFCLENIPEVAKTGWHDETEVIKALDQAPLPVQDVASAISEYFEIMLEIDEDNLRPGEDPPDLSIYTHHTPEELYGKVDTKHLLATAFLLYLKQYSPKLGEEVMQKWKNNEDIETESSQTLTHMNDLPVHIQHGMVRADNALLRFEEWANSGKSEP